MGVLDDLDAATSQAERQQIKAAYLAERLAALNLPRTVGPVTITAVTVKQIPGGWAVTIDGTGGNRPSMWPWTVINPPLLVDDPAGTIVRTYTDPNGNVTTRRFRLDPVAAIRQKLTQLAS